MLPPQRSVPLIPKQLSSFSVVVDSCPHHCMSLQEGGPGLPPLCSSSAWPRVWHGAQGPLPVLEPVHARHREAARQLAEFSSLEYKPGCTHRIHECEMEMIGYINHWFGKALKYFHNIVCFFSKTDVPSFHEKVIKCV